MHLLLATDKNYSDRKHANFDVFPPSKVVAKMKMTPRLRKLHTKTILHFIKDMQRHTGRIPRRSLSV